MKKKIVGFLFAFILAIQPAAAFAEDESEAIIKESAQDFDEKTNIVEAFFGFDFSIPPNWELSESGIFSTYYLAEPGSESAIFQLQCDSAPVGSLSEIEVDIDDALEAYCSGCDSVNINESSVEDILGNTAFFYDYTATFEGTVSDRNTIFFVDERSSNFIVINFIQNIDSEFDHFDDFKKIVDSISFHEQEPQTESSSVSVEYENALESAQSYLSFSAFSYSGLIDQLEYEGYSSEACAYAVDNCGADWNEQALKSAQSYLEYSAFSYSGLADQLEYEGFTAEQATYAVDNCGADWNEQAAKSAQSYLDYSSFSRQELLDQLLYEGFSNEQAEYGVTAVGY